MDERRDEWVTVYRAWGETECNIVAGLLKSSGIPCFSEGTAAPSVHPFTIDGLGEIRIKVSRENAFAAQHLILENRGHLLDE